MNVNGQIIKILDVQIGVSKDGKEWQKQTFVIDNNEKYNNIFAFEIFGEEKVQNFTKYNKLHDIVDVEFNVSCNEWQGKFFTTLNAWKISKTANDVKVNKPVFETTDVINNDDKDDLPF